MSAVKILVVENDLLIAENIKSIINRSGYEITGMLTHGEDLEASVKKHQPDIIIMDIKLDGDMDGIVTVKNMKQQTDIPVIYLTDIDDKQTIKRAEETNPSAYLLKPFTERQLLASIHLALHNFSKGSVGRLKDNTPADEYVKIKDAFFIRTGNGRFEKISTKSIRYIQADGNYTYLFTTADTKHTLTTSLNHVLETLSGSGLIRVSRSYAVNMDEVTVIKGNMLVLDKVEIPVGETYRQEVMAYFPYLK